MKGTTFVHVKFIESLNPLLFFLYTFVQAISPGPMAVVNAQNYISLNSTLINNIYLNYLYDSAYRAFQI